VDYDCWKIAKAVLPVADRVLLHGKQKGTGKTTIAQRYGLKQDQNSVSLYLTEYTPVHEIRGSIYPQLTKAGDRKWEWLNGPALEAYQNGGRLVINEINDTSDDCVTFLLALLDDKSVSKITLPDGKVITPHPNFSVVATMNAEPEDLHPALRDRFPITIHIDKPNPEAIAALPRDLQESAMACTSLEEDRYIGMRQWMAFAELRDTHQLDLEICASACFGTQAEEVYNAFQLGETYHGYRY